MSYLGKSDEANVLKALDDFDQSERADPGFIYPYVGSSTICLRLRLCEPQSKLIADIDPVALDGLFYRFRKWDEAVYFYKRAAELKPSAFFLRVLGECGASFPKG